MTLGEGIQVEIKETDRMSGTIEKMAKELAPPVVQEIVLAQRHVEDANNRLKRAYNKLPEELK